MTTDHAVGGSNPSQRASETAAVPSPGRRPLHVTADLVDRLRAAGCVFAEDEAALLVEAAVTADELERLVARRVAGEPLEPLLGWAAFCGLRIPVASGVFVPRRRTELLVREAVARTPAGGVVVDLCCGTGAVGAAIAHAVPGIELHAADVDPAAVACARRTLAGIGQVHAGDLDAALPDTLRGRVDVLVANAPYVPTDEVALMPVEARLHEPRVALDGGADGLAVVARVVAAAPGWLARGGHVMVESSPRQAHAVCDLLATVGRSGRVVGDVELEATVVVG